MNTELDLVLRAKEYGIAANPYNHTLVVHRNPGLQGCGVIDALCTRYKYRIMPTREQRAKQAAMLANAVRKRTRR